MSSQNIEFASKNAKGSCPGVLAGDPKTASWGLIVLQEWWGMNQQIQDKGKELSDQGSMVTLVPDLYRGKCTNDQEEAGHLMGGLDWKGAVDDIQGCAEYLKKQGVKKVGVTGFCMGGALAMAAAALVPEVDAAVPFYGIPSAELCDVTKITVPLQCHFAENDQTFGFASPKEWKPLKEKLEKHIKVLEFYEYDANHAFTNKTSPNYDESKAKEAFQRMFDFFKKHF